MRAVAIDPNPGHGIYASAKGDLVAYAKRLSKGSAPKSILVNCILLGLVKTPMMEATCKQLGSDFLEREQKLYSLGTQAERRGRAGIMSAFACQAQIS